MSFNYRLRVSLIFIIWMDSKKVCTSFMWLTLGQDNLFREFRPLKYLEDKAIWTIYILFFQYWWFKEKPFTTYFVCWLVFNFAYLITVEHSVLFHISFIARLLLIANKLLVLLDCLAGKFLLYSKLKYVPQWVWIYSGIYSSPLFQLVWLLTSMIN